MEENQVKSSKCLYVVIIILSIAVLCMGLFIAYDKGVIFSKKTTATGDSNKVVENNNNETTNPTVNKLSEEEAMKIGQELWDYALGTYWGDSKVWPTHKSETPNELGAYTRICDTTPEQVKTKYTTDFKADYYVYGYVDSNYKPYTLEDFVGNDCHGSVGRGSNVRYKGTTLSINSIEENEIIFNTTSNYASYVDNDNNSETIVKDFTIKKVNGNWLISYFYLPN